MRLIDWDPGRCKNTEGLPSRGNLRAGLKNWPRSFYVHKKILITFKKMGILKCQLNETGHITMLQLNVMSIMPRQVSFFIQT